MGIISASLEENAACLDRRLAVGKSFDIVSRPLVIAGRKSRFYVVDGMCKDELLHKLLEFFLGLKEKELPKEPIEMARRFMPTVEMELENDVQKIEKNLLSGVFCLLIDGYDQCILIDARTYPARSVEEPEKDKALRGAKDCFVETVVFNTAMIRRRIRSSDLRMEMYTIGESSRTDVVLSYMDSRVNRSLLDKVRNLLSGMKVDALVMSQESLAERIYQSHKLSPFPKFKYSERPDTVSAQILEGSIAILVDNSPFVMILPTTAFSILEEADDYYFPPVTGTYLRLSRALIIVMSYFVAPTFLLLMMYPEWIPDGLAFIRIKGVVNVPLILQFLMLEIAIDGLKLAAVNTPNMLSTPFSVLAALIFGEFSVNSGWFNAEVMLYMVFVAIANYTQQSYEFAYAIKFHRMITLILTATLGIYGYAAGVLLLLLSLFATKTVDGKRYFYPLIPCNIKSLYQRLVRK